MTLKFARATVRQARTLSDALPCQQCVACLKFSVLMTFVLGCKSESSAVGVFNEVLNESD